MKRPDGGQCMNMHMYEGGLCSTRTFLSVKWLESISNQFTSAKSASGDVTFWARRVALSSDGAIGARGIGDAMRARACMAHIWVREKFSHVQASCRASTSTLFMAVALQYITLHMFYNHVQHCAYRAFGLKMHKASPLRAHIYVYYWLHGCCCTNVNNWTTVSSGYMVHICPGKNWLNKRKDHISDKFYLLTINKWDQQKSDHMAEKTIYPKTI